MTLQLIWIRFSYTFNRNISYSCKNTLRPNFQFFVHPLKRWAFKVSRNALHICSVPVISINSNTYSLPIFAAIVQNDFPATSFVCTKQIINII